MTYKLNEAKMFADISAGLAIVINSETGVYYGMNPFTSSIFENLVNGISSESIISAVKELDGAPEDFESRFDELVSGLLAKELIVSDPEGETGKKAEIDPGYAKECDFSISWDEFLDAQELLLADPIHEVREEEGWSPEQSALNPDSEDVARRKAKMD